MRKRAWAGLAVSLVLVALSLLALLALKSPVTGRKFRPLGAGVVGALLYLAVLVPSLAILRDVALGA